MLTPMKANVVTANPASAHHEATVPRSPFIKRMCSQAA